MKITELEEKVRLLDEKNQMLKKSLDKMYDQERKDMNEIDYLKMKNDHLKERNTELYDDRNIMRGIIRTLKKSMKLQNSQLDAWMDCYRKSWEDRDYPAEEEDDEWKPELVSEEEEEVEEEVEESEEEEQEEESEQEQECELEYEDEHGNYYHDNFDFVVGNPPYPEPLDYIMDTEIWSPTSAGESA